MSLPLTQEGSDLIPKDKTLFTKKTYSVRLNRTFLDISSHCYRDNVKVMCSELCKYSHHDTVYKRNCVNIKIYRQIIWKCM